MAGSSVYVAWSPSLLQSSTKVIDAVRSTKEHAGGFLQTKDALVSTDLVLFTAQARPWESMILIPYEDVVRAR